MTLIGIALVDTLTDLDGNNTRNPVPEFVSSEGSPEGTLAPGETATYSSTVTLTQDDIEAGGLSNSLVATAGTSQGGSLADTSDDNGVGDDDPTQANVAALPSLDVTKEVAETRYLFPTVEQTTFSITVTNTGNVIQTGISVSDDLAGFAAPATLLSATYPVEVTASGFADGDASSSYDGEADTELLSGNPTLAPGETGTITVTVTYSTASGAPGAFNVADAVSDQLADPASGAVEVIVSDTDGDGIPDALESPTADRDGDGIPDRDDYDPTGYFYCEDTGSILSGGAIAVSGGGATQSGAGTTGPITIVEDGSSGVFQFYVTAPGTYTLALTYPPSGVPSVDRLTSGTLDVTSLLPDNPAALGSGEFGSTGALADFSAGANVFYTTFVIEAGDPFLINNNIPLTECAGGQDVLATKTADRSTAVFGETINYTLTFRNDSSRRFVDARIVDSLPAGLVYTPGTAVVDGTRVEPVIGGGDLVWTVDLDPAQTITATFAARVRSSGSFGTLTNTALMQDADGNQVSNTARADVEILPEAVFDCSDVIGKVFDDVNGNGYQDGPTRDPGITDQTYSGDKFDAPPEPVDRTEPGLPGVRLVTVDGLLITTDDYGRFNVPCAALPPSIGQNFQLKLDTDTLPDGYYVTTENPRNMRLTAGIMTEMNFGARLGQLVEIALDARAFGAGSAAPSVELAAAVEQMVAQLAGSDTTIQLSYALGAGEAPATARARLRALTNLIEDRWRGQSRHDLTIERNVQRVSR